MILFGDIKALVMSANVSFFVFVTNIHYGNIDYRKKHMLLHVKYDQ